MAGRTTITVIPSPTKPTVIQIMFSRTPTMMPLLQFTCPDRNGKTFTSNNEKAAGLAASILPAFPQQVKFEAKEEEQTILKIGNDGDEIFVKFTVKQLDD
ncbi:MAG: hypothetical protein ABIR18_01245, partial [Chitinophagaceae bacterium]